METMEELNINIRFGRKNLLPLLVLFFLCWHPGYIGSASPYHLLPRPLRRLREHPYHRPDHPAGTKQALSR
jgi:hypothetical protein